MKDRRGDPIVIGSFVRVERASGTKFRGTVTEMDGELLWIHEWKGGRYGNVRPARPENATTTRKPARVKGEEKALVNAKLAGRRMR